MEDEIKEFNEEKYVEMLEDGTLYDYITNLQEELDGIKDNFKIQLEYDEELENKIINLQEENDYYFKKNNELSTLNTSLRSDRDNYKSRNEKTKSLTNRTIEIIKQQPSGNDEWILERLNGINYCLGGDEEC